MSSAEKQNVALGTAFHESFALNRPAMQQVLDFARQSPSRMTFSSLRENTNLGKNFVKSMPRYCFGCGLLSPDNQLSPFGEAVVEHDPALQKPQTQWLMHYHLSVGGGPGPAFWHDLVVKRIRVGAVVDTDEVAEWIAESALSSGSKPLAQRTRRDTARVFLRTYSRDDGLNQLDLIRESDAHARSYEVKMPSPPGAWVIGLALADLWRRHWPQQATANLNDVSDILGEVFLSGRSSLSDALRELQRHELIDVFRVAPPYQVVRTWDDEAQFWSQLYE